MTWRDTHNDHDCNRLALPHWIVAGVAKALCLTLLMTSCSTSLRRIDVEGDSCEKLKVIYDSDKREARGPAG